MFSARNRIISTKYQLTIFRFLLKLIPVYLRSGSAKNLLASTARLCLSHVPNKLFDLVIACFLNFSTNLSTEKFRERMLIEHLWIFRHCGHDHCFSFPLTSIKHFSQKSCPHFVDFIGDSYSSEKFIKLTINGTVLREPFLKFR